MMPGGHGRSEPLYRVLGKLERVKKSGPGYSASCPCPRHEHGDKDPSLSVAVGYDGKVLLKCHAGCPTEDILAALEMTWGDLFEQTANGNPVRRFRLISSSGQVVAEHVREDLPNDKIIRWESNGKNGLNGTRTEDLPLYRLPDLLAADPTCPVIVCEGEKAAEALAELGLLAVGTVTGAGGTPSDAALAPLQGHDVRLWADNDTPGHEHMTRIAGKLKPPPSWVIWPDAPEKGDAADYVAGGGTAEGIERLVTRTLLPVKVEPRPGPRIWSGPELAAMTFAATRWAIPTLLPAGLAILAGRPKLGKSWLGLGWALDIPRPAPALRKLAVVQGETLYLALEDGPQRMQERMALMLGDTPPPAGFYVVTEWPRTNEGGIEALDEWLTEHPNARMVVIDTFKRVRPIEKNSQRLYDLDYDAMAPLATLARQHNITIVVVFHTRKGESSDPLEMVSGTLGLSGAADAVLVLRRERGQADASLFVTGRDVEEQDLALRWEKEDLLGWTLLGNAEQFRISAERQAVLDAIGMAPGMAPMEIAEMVDKTRGSVRKLLFCMVRDGEVRTREGKYFPLARAHATPIGNSGNSSPNGTPKDPVSISEPALFPVTNPAVTGGNSGNSQSQNPVTADLRHTPSVTGNAPVTAITSITSVTPVTAVTALCKECGKPMLEHGPLDHLPW